MKRYPNNNNNKFKKINHRIFKKSNTNFPGSKSCSQYFSSTLVGSKLLTQGGPDTVSVSSPVEGSRRQRLRGEQSELQRKRLSGRLLIGLFLSFLPLILLVSTRVIQSKKFVG